MRRRYEDLAPLAAAGAELIRIRPRDKAPQDAGWRTLSLTYKEVAAHVQNGGNAGWRLGAPDLVIDVDPRNFAKGDDPLPRLCADTGLDLTLCPHVLTGSGGHHYYLTKPRDFMVLDTLPAYSGIEFKTLGRQVVVPGSIHPCGELYEWDDFAPDPSSRPVAPDTLLDLIRRPDLIVGSGGGELTPEHIQALLVQITPENYRAHDKWLPIMMACHHGSAGEARAEFVAWSASDPEFRDDHVMVGRRWDSLHADRHTGITFKTLYREVLNAGGTIPHDSPEHDFGSDPLEEIEVGITPAVARLAEMNERHCLVFDGAMKIYTKEYDTALERFYYARYSRFDFEMWYHNKKIPGVDEQMTLSTWWLKHPQRSEYRGLVFDPGRDTEGFLNLWQGFSVKGCRGPWDAFDDLIRNTICSGDEVLYEYTMNWLAHLVQRPGEPAETAFVMRGPKGTGKGTFATAIMSLIKAHAIQVSSSQHFTGRFNAHLRDCVLLFVDEAFWAGDHGSEGTLKRLITEPTLVYEGKGQNAVVGKNCISVMIASNADWVVPAGLDGERRYVMTDVGTNRVGDETFWSTVRTQLYQDGGLGGLFRFLQERNIVNWHPRNDVPQTCALAEQKLHGLTDIEEWWLNRLTEGSLPGQQVDWSSGETETPMQVLHEHYLAEVGGLGRRNRRASQISFGRQLKKIIPGYDNIQAVHHGTELIVADSRGRVQMLRCDSLTKCRAAFETRLGMAIGEEDFLS